MEIKTETTIKIPAEELKKILCEYFSQPNAKIKFNLGTIGDDRFGNTSTDLTSVSVTYDNPVKTGFTNKPSSSSYLDSLGR